MFRMYGITGICPQKRTRIDFYLFDEHPRFAGVLFAAAKVLLVIYKNNTVCYNSGKAAGHFFAKSPKNVEVKPKEALL